MNRLLLLHLLILGVYGTSDIEQPKFKVCYTPAIPDSSLAPQLTLENDAYEIVKIDNENTNLLCYIPQIHNLTTVNDVIDDTNTLEDSPRTESTLLTEILPNFSHYFDAQRCFFTTGLNEGYWTYGYCFGDKIVQFHENLAVFQQTGVHQPEFPNHVFVLGRFQGSDSKDPKILNQSTAKSRSLQQRDFSIVNDPYKTSDSIKGSPKALKHVLSDGGLCDLTNEPRTIEIIYRCDPSMDLRIGIVGVSEIKTCDYQMIINVKGLCQIPEFAPNNAEEKIVDVVCNDVSEDTDKDNKEIVFPQPQSTVVDIQDFDLQPGGNGFFWGRPKNYDVSEDFYDRRTVVFYNEDVVNERRFIHEFSRMFSNSMEFKIRSPDLDSANGLATWDDMFTGWYEIYDHHGRFFKVMKVARVGSVSNKGLNLQLVDPFAMTDQDGDPINPPKPPVIRSMYEYEKFSRGVTEQPIDEGSGKIVEKSTVTVTQFSQQTKDPAMEVEGVLEELRKRLGIDEKELQELIQERQSRQQEQEEEEEQHQEQHRHDEL